MLSLVTVYTVRAQPASLYSITTIAAKDGLPSSEVFCLYQDASHYLWIGHAAGVSRYNGYHFENFLFANGHRIGTVRAIRQDAKGRVWIAADGGCFLYSNNQVHALLTAEQNLAFTGFCFDDTGGAWLACGKGPAYLDAAQLNQYTSFHTIAITPLLLPAWKKAFNYDEAPVIMVKDKAGNLYCSTNFMLCRYNGKRLDTIWRADDPLGYITSVVSHTPDSLYISTYDGGLLLLHHQQITRIRTGEPSGTALIAHNSQLFYMDVEGIKTTAFNSDTATMIAAIPEGFNKWGSSLLVDDENNIWVGNHEGLLFLRKKKFFAYNKDAPELQEAYSLGCNANGKLALGSNRGRLFFFNDNAFIAQPPVVPLAEVKAIFKDVRNWLWFGTGYQGIACRKDGHTENFTMANGLRDNTNLFFYETTKHELWCGGDGGITNIKVGANNRISFRNFRNTPRNEMYATFNSCIEAPDGSLWLGSNWGLFHFIQDSLQQEPSPDPLLKNVFIADMKADRLQRIWIATRGSGILLARFDNTGKLKIIKQFGPADGLNIATYVHLLVDKENTLWAGSYAGITRIQSPDDTQFFIDGYNAADGFINNNYQDIALQQDATGTIWAATTNGLTSFHPADFKNNFIPTLALNTVQLKDTVLAATNTSKPVELSYNNNSVTFTFTGIHLSNPLAINYYYRLHGADTNWVNSGNNQSATFRNLAPGKYTFEAKAASSSNHYSNTVYYAFQVLPPFWKTWWFIGLMALALLFMVAYLVNSREQRIKNKEAQKTELQKLKTIGYQYQLEIEQVINYFATSMSGLTNSDEVLWDVAKNCISKLGFEDCVIYMKDQRGNVLVQKAAWGPKTTAGNRIHNPIEIPLGRGIVGTVAVTGKAEIVSDTTLDSRYIVDDQQRYSEITVPILHNNTVIGVIDSEHSQKAFYTSRHLQVLNTIASLCADKMDKVNAEQSAREKEMEIIQINHDLATSQLTALRAQMNPHFIFNALNSIQQYILQGNVDEANKYLSKFSRLQREILNHCDQNFITLEKEIEMLELYLQLEQLRLLENFTYSLTLVNEIDTAEIKIPPMMLQPFVENAIWHGLMPKEGERNVSIRFELQEDDLLTCTITDNGIGRAAASRLKKPETGATHKSKGLSLVYERLKILQQQYQQLFQVAITDLPDDPAAINPGNPDNRGRGTCVTLTIFVGH